MVGRYTRKPARRSTLLNRLAPLAAAPLIGLLGAGAAQAACTTFQGSPLAALQPDDDVGCAGTTNGVVIQGVHPQNQPAASVTVGFGATLSNSVVYLEGAGPYFRAEPDAILDGVTITLVGPGGLAELIQTTGTIELTVTGDASSINITNGSDITATGAGITIEGEGSQFTLGVGSILRPGAGLIGPLIEGGDGTQVFTIAGSAFAPPGAALLVAGGGDDLIIMSNGTPAQPGEFYDIEGDGGAGAAGTDTLRISGPGSYELNAVNIERLVVTNAGTVSLQGFGSWSNVFIEDSILALGNRQAIGVSGAAININQNGQLWLVTSASNVTVDQVFSGAGILRFDGTSDFQVSGDNSGFSGQFRVQGSGSVLFQTQNSLGSAQILNSGTLSFASGLTVANAISGTGSVVYNGAGTTSLTGANTYSGGTAINSGVLRVQTLSSLGSGAVSIAAGGELLIDNSADQVFGSNLSGAGILRKSGTGLLSFSQPFTVGSLRIDQGRVRLNVVATTNVTVASGARLDGTGRVIGSLTNGGVVAPGNSIGTLTVQGNYVQGAAGVLEIEFDGAGGIDLLDITGTATLGGTLRFVSIGGAEGAGGTFLQAAGGVTGTFANVETVGANLPLAVVYTPNNASMAPSVLTARPSTFNAQFQASADTAVGVIDALPLLLGSNSETDTLWAEVFASSAERSAEGASLGFAYDVSGLTAGYSHRFNDVFSLGFSVATTQADIGLDEGAGGGEQTGLLGTVFGRYGDGNVVVAGGVLFGSLDQQTQRSVTFSGVRTTVQGETTSTVSAVFGSAYGRFATIGGWEVGASAGAGYVVQSQEGYREAGTSPLRLDIPSVDAETRYAQAALSLNRSFSLGAPDSGPERRLDLGLSVGARYTDVGDDRAIPVNFVGSGAAVTLLGDTRETVQGVLGVEAGYRVTDRVTFGVGYTGLFGETDSHEARVGIYVGF